MQNVYSTQWIRKINEILQRCGLFNILVNQHNMRVQGSKAIRLLICTSFKDQYEQAWHSSIPAHIRCSYYVLFKDNRKLEPGAYAGFLRGGGPTLKFLVFWIYMRICEPLLGGFGGMPPQENFKKCCNFVSFEGYFQPLSW